MIDKIENFGKKSLEKVVDVLNTELTFNGLKGFAKRAVAPLILSAGILAAPYIAKAAPENGVQIVTINQYSNKGEEKKKTTTAEEVADFLVNNGPAVFGFGVSTDYCKTEKDCVKICLTPEEELKKNPQNPQKARTEQFSEALNKLFLYNIPDEELLPIVQDIVAKYASSRGFSIDRSKIGFKRISTADNKQNGPLVDIVYETPVKGFTAVDGKRGTGKNHIDWYQDTCFEIDNGALNRVNVPLIRAVYAPKPDYQNQKVADGKTSEKDGLKIPRCDQNTQYLTTDNKGELVCANLPRAASLTPETTSSTSSQTGQPSTPPKTGQNYTGQDSKPYENKKENKKVEEQKTAKVSKSMSNLDIYANIGYGSESWKSTVEIPDENGVPVKTTERSNNSDVGAGIAVIYNIAPNIVGLGVEAQIDSYSGTEHGVGVSGGPVLTLGDHEKTGIVGLEYEISDKTLDRKDDSLKISREIVSSGFAANYTSPNLLRDEKREIRIAGGYKSLTGKSNTTPDFEDISIKGEGSKDSYSETGYGISASALFVPTKIGTFGITGGADVSQMKIGEDKWDTTTYRGALAYTKEIGKGDLKAAIDAQIGYQAATQDAHNPSIKDSNMNGFYFSLGIRPSGKGKWYFNGQQR